MGTMTDTRRAQVMTALGNPDSKETSGDFSELTATLPTRYVDLSDPTRKLPPETAIRRSSGGVARSVPVVPDMRGHAVKADTDDSYAPRDLRTVAQRDLMDSLLAQLHDLDINTYGDALTYTARMTQHGKWTPGRGGNASVWIGRMIAKVRELKARPVSVVPVASSPAGRDLIAHDELIIRETKTGKPMPQYYAVEIDGVLKFYRVKAGTKPGWWWIDAQASDEFHPIRNVGTKNDILRAIIMAGPEACMRRYGREINHCGRCHRTLTDETSRANGIGPECEGKL